MTESLKSATQRLLQRAGIYQRIRSSVFYDLYWGMMDSRWITERSAEIAFYERTLVGFSRGNMIFDIGANQGHKTDVFIRLGARVVAADPDPTNQKILRDRFLRLRLFPKNVSIVGKAISASEAVATMWVDSPGSAKNTLNTKWVNTLRQDENRFGARMSFDTQRQVETTTLESLIGAYGRPFFIKIDVEGHEPSVLAGLQSPVPYLSFEVNLPEFRAEGRQCVSRLCEICAKGEFNYAPDCQRGLTLRQWVAGEEFLRLFESIKDPSIEVFWRTHSSDVQSSRS